MQTAAAGSQLSSTAIEAARARQPLPAIAEEAPGQAPALIAANPNAKANANVNAPAPPPEHPAAAGQAGEAQQPGRRLRHGRDGHERKRAI